MDEASKQRWLSTVIFAGVIYLAVAVASSGLVAFIAWPLLTGLPAFNVAFVVAVLLGLKSTEKF